MSETGYETLQPNEHGEYVIQETPTFGQPDRLMARRTEAGLLIYIATGPFQDETPIGLIPWE